MRNHFFFVSSLYLSLPRLFSAFQVVGPGNQNARWTPLTTCATIGQNALRSTKSTTTTTEDDMVIEESSETLTISSSASFDYSTSLPESEYTQVLVSELPTIAQEIRKIWDERFQDPRQPNQQRFSWDPWYVQVGDGRKNTNGKESRDEENDDNRFGQRPVEGEMDATNRQIQYSLKRTTTSTFLQNKKNEEKSIVDDNQNDNDDLYQRLVDTLIDLGTSVGLTAISPPWISLYTEGDTQNFHTDAPHGPLAFVLSLCQKGDFVGGETMLFQPRMLDYWRGFDGRQGLECGSIVRYVHPMYRAKSVFCVDPHSLCPHSHCQCVLSVRFIPPTPLGRCIAFDPRVPHGVNRVHGTQDPRKGRIVIHGWFNEPETCWFGPWEGDRDLRMEIVDNALSPLVQTLGTGDIGRVVGYLAVRLEIDEDGYVEEVQAVCDTLQTDWDDFRGIIGYDEADNPVMEDAVSDVKLTAYEALKKLSFESGTSGRALVVPFLFE